MKPSTFIGTTLLSAYLTIWQPSESKAYFPPIQNTIHQTSQNTTWIISQTEYQNTVTQIKKILTNTKINISLCKPDPKCKVLAILQNNETILKNLLKLKPNKLIHKFNILKTISLFSQHINNLTKKIEQEKLDLKNTSNFKASKKFWNYKSIINNEIIPTIKNLISFSSFKKQVQFLEN